MELKILVTTLGAEKNQNRIEKQLEKSREYYSKKKKSMKKLQTTFNYNSLLRYTAKLRGNKKLPMESYSLV